MPTRSIVVALAAFAVGGLPVAGPPRAIGQEPAPAPDAAALASDLDSLIVRLRATHPRLEGVHPRADWDAQITALRARLEGMDVARFAVELGRIVALAGDGHTRVEVEHTEAWRATLPVRFHRFEDGLFVVAAAPSCATLAGRRVVRIGGREVEALLDEARRLVSADHVAGADVLTPLALVSRAALEVLGAAQSSKAIEIVTADVTGTLATNALAAEVPGGDPFVAPAGWTVVAPPADGAISLRPRSATQPYWFEPVDGEPAVYFRFDAVQDAGKETLAAFVDRLFRFVEENECERLIVDLRGNDGGDNYLNQPLIHAVIRSARIDRPGHLFVLTSPFTYSAAVNCASDLERETWALFVGGPTGAGANHCGDPKAFVLPNTRIPVRCSTVVWQKSDPNDARRALLPDVPAATTFAEWRAGRDAALEAALAFDPAQAAAFAKIPPVAHWRRPSQTPRR